MNETFVLRNPADAQRLYALLRSNWVAMAEAGKPLAVTIAEHKAKRSDEQNRKLHAMLRDLAQNAWVQGRRYDEETWKEMIRRKFIGTEEIDLPDGRRIERGISTTALGVAEFSELIEHVIQWANEELGVFLA